MKRGKVFAVLIGAAAALTTAAVLAQGSLDIGKREYEANCASCHGLSGKGDGSFAQWARFRMPDLTMLARKNGGVFPVKRVYEVIDGREIVRAHGDREMPIWGVDYKIKSAPQYDDWPHDSESFVRARITSLIDYLYRLQAR